MRRRVPGEGWRDGGGAGELEGPLRGREFIFGHLPFSVSESSKFARARARARRYLRSGVVRLEISPFMILRNYIFLPIKQ